MVVVRAGLVPTHHVVPRASSRKESGPNLALTHSATGSLDPCITPGPDPAPPPVGIHEGWPDALRF